MAALTRAAAVEAAKRAIPWASDKEIDAAVASLFMDTIKDGLLVDSEDAIAVMRTAWRKGLLAHSEMVLAMMFLACEEPA